MITDIITGLFVGIAMTAIAMYAFLFYAKRRGWAELRIEPRSEIDLSTRSLVDSLMEDIEELNTRMKYVDDINSRLTDLENQLAPYLGKKDE